MSLIEEGKNKMVRMAYLSIAGSHSTNGVAALHTELLKSRLVPEFAEVFNDRFNNKTNGITQRRWLLKANPSLAGLITDSIGPGWITDMAELEKLKPFSSDPAFLDKFVEIKQSAKINLSNYVKKEYGIALNPETLFDVQVKRIHEYKRQFLNVLHIIMDYNRIKKNGSKTHQPRTYLFSGKAAPGYAAAKLVIKLINNIASVINNDPDVKELISVHFLPNYRVSMAELIFPASDLSEQISTAGTEASGTGNMKFMCNGALTIGTLDGANIEIIKEAGEENVFIFGLKAEEIASLRDSYDPYKYYSENKEIKSALDLLFSGYFNFAEPGIFEPFKRMLFDEGDRYFHLADLPSYCRAHDRVSSLYSTKNSWNSKAVLNIASSGKFSSDRTIKEYADEIWKVKPCAIEMNSNPADTLMEAMQKSRDRSQIKRK